MRELTAIANEFESAVFINLLNTNTSITSIVCADSVLEGYD